MDVSQSILSDLTVYMKYARFIPDLKRREVWKEIVDRNEGMHIEKFPQLREEIEEAYKLVYDRKVLPSMRSLQFGGRPIELNNARIYNCSFLPIDDYRSFSEAMFLLLSGCGVGFSVQLHHVEKLPEVKVPTKSKRFLVSDSIEGWADAVKVLCKAYFTGGTLPKFDFRDVRPKGALLITSGGKAPGPEPLKECLFQIQKIFDRKNTGDKLTSLECHDIVCFLADAVLSGGIRRAALISLFNLDDEDMLTCKFGNWWEQNPQRGRANNSAVILRHKITEEEFFKLWKKIELSGSGEPGMYFSNDKDWGTNPCCFVGDTLIETESGKMSIKEIVEAVNNGQTCKVKTFNEGTGQIEVNTVKAGQLTKKDAVVVKLTVVEAGISYSVTCTPDHRFFTTNRGWVECKNLTNEDDIIVYPSLI
jgi:ribonucleoside-diphosphate reductase alpha chain